MLSIFKQAPMVDLRSVNFKEINIIGARAYTNEEYILSLGYANHIKEETRQGNNTQGAAGKRS